MADEELQEPEKQNKKKKKEKGGMSMPVVIGMVMGILVVNVALVFLIMKFVFSPEPTVMTDSTGKVIQTEHSESGEESGTEDDEEELDELDQEEKDFFAKDEKRKFFETDRILTNPKGSTKAVMIKLGVEYRPKLGMDEEEEAALLKADGEFMIKLMAYTRSVVINELGSMTEDFMLNNSKDTLAFILRDGLKDYYKGRKLFLRKIQITEFIIQ
jgi:flagellar basal body-associated protein FliL